MYKIRLPNFEGPFDLLLYFIKRDELNIYDIPIARITGEFLNYVKVMQFFDLELAGEFVLMASNLMYIKTQMLLPRKENEEDDDIEDPRTQLVQKLIEYKQFKEAAGELSTLAENQRYTYYREFFEYDDMQDEYKNYYKNTSLFDLLKAFKIALDRSKEEPKNHVVNLFPVTVDEKKEYIQELIEKKKRVGFFEITKGADKPHIIVTFLAILELIRSRVIIIMQSDIFDDIMISGRPQFNLN